MNSWNKILVLALLFLMLSCASNRYIHDAESLERQEKLLSERTTNTGCEVMGCMSSVLFSALIGTDLGYEPSEREFKRLKIINPTADTMYINMLSDMMWDTVSYVDFNDVRIPPWKTWRVLVPIGINYNLYFGTSTNPEKDELMEINTSGKRVYKLIPAYANPGSLENW